MAVAGAAGADEVGDGALRGPRVKRSGSTWATVDTSAQDPTRAPRAQISGIVYRVAYSELVTARLAFISWSGQPLAHAQTRPQRVDP